MEILTGSICLSNIPKDQMKKVMCKDGVERIYRNIAVIEREKVGQYGDTHFVSCSPKQELRKEGVNYIFGDLKRFVPKSSAPTSEDINNAPPINEDDCPFQPMLYDLSNSLQRENFKVRVNKLYKDNKTVELTEKKPIRTLPQNRYLHLILGFFSSQYGCDLEYAKKNYFKILCNKEIFIREIDDKYLGKIKTLRSSSELDTSEMTIAIERFRNWSASEAGIYLPDANEEDMLTFAQQEIERCKQYL